MFVGSHPEQLDSKIVIEGVDLDSEYQCVVTKTNADSCTRRVHCSEALTFDDMTIHYATHESSSVCCCLSRWSCRSLTSCDRTCALRTPTDPTTITSVMVMTHDTIVT